MRIITQRNFENILILALVTGCMIHPASCAAGLLILAGSQIAERYFTRNVSDLDRQVIGQLKVDVDKHDVILKREGLSKAFGGARGQV